MVEGIAELFAKREQIRGLRFVERPATLPHFAARFARLGSPATEAREVEMKT